MQYVGQPDRKAAAANRIRWVAAALLLWAGWICQHLYLIQIKDHYDYTRKARAQQEHRVDVPAPRGTIFDRNGQPMAVSVPTEAVAVDPRRITDLNVATETLGNLLNLDKDVLRNRIKAAAALHKGFLMVKRRMDPFEAKNLRELHLEYASYLPGSRRNYPNGATGVHVVGLSLIHI